MTAQHPRGTLKRMRFFSLKWKLSISFVVMALGFVGLYVILAKRTFEFDKISYIFETQQRQVSALARSFDMQTERMLFDARSILGGFDPASRKLSPGAQRIFWDHPHILGLRLRTEGIDKALLQIEKSQGFIEALGKEWHKGKNPQLRPLGQDRYVLSLAQTVSGASPVEMQVLFEYREALGNQIKGQMMALNHGGRLLKRTPGAALQDSSITEALKSLPNTETTLERKIENEDYLISVANAASGLQFASFSRKGSALGALNLLFRRSMVFLLFSFFATVIISLLLSNRLTQNINQLTVTAEKIGQGDFTTTAEVRSRDEVGILARAFQRMSGEIQRLLNETVDKTRMEEELKTARLVQESLFPVSHHYQSGNIRLSGMNKTTTECSGDWWFYYQRGDDLYVLVADATGHGIPAALITAAARSVFSVVKDGHSDLKEIMNRWDRATFECSNGKVFMTAFLMRVNVELGHGVYINAGHEPPVLLRTSSGGKMKGSFEIGNSSPCLGECRGLWLENPIQLQAGDRLLIYTDGLLAVKSPDGKGYSERRFLTYLERIVNPGRSPSDFVSQIDQHFMELNANQPLPDDITMLAMDFKAKST